MIALPWYAWSLLALQAAIALIVVFDAARLPLAAWTAGERSRTVWIALALFAVLVPVPFAPVAVAILYLLDVRPRLRRTHASAA